jgi:Domain of unknown function (DUF4126)
MLLAIGTGIGFASVAGVRAFLPLLVAVLAVQVGFLVAPSPYDGSLNMSEWWSATGVIAALAVVEVVLDKIRGGAVYGGVRLRAGRGVRTVARGRGVDRPRRGCAQGRSPAVIEDACRGGFGVVFEHLRGRGGVGGRRSGGVCAVRGARAGRFFAILLLQGEEAAGQAVRGTSHPPGLG